MKKIRVSCLIKMGGGLVNPRSAFPTYTPVVPTSPIVPLTTEAGLVPLTLCLNSCFSCSHGNRKGNSLSKPRSWTKVGKRRSTKVALEFQEKRGRGCFFVEAKNSLLSPICKHPASPSPTGVPSLRLAGPLQAFRLWMFQFDVCGWSRGLVSSVSSCCSVLICSSDLHGRPAVCQALCPAPGRGH